MEVENMEQLRKLVVASTSLMVKGLTMMVMMMMMTMMTLPPLAPLPHYLSPSLSLSL